MKYINISTRGFIRIATDIYLVRQFKSNKNSLSFWTYQAFRECTHHIGIRLFSLWDICAYLKNVPTIGDVFTICKKHNIKIVPNP